MEIMEDNNKNTINIIDKSETLKTSDDNDNKNTNHDDIQKFMNELRPLYPPFITPELLMPKSPSSQSSRKLSSGINNKRKKESSVKFPNAFIAYRMEFCRQLKNKRMCLTMQDVSYFASKLWKKEPCDVKKTYTQLANDAKLLYEKRKKDLLLAEEEQRRQQQIETESITNLTNISSLSSLNPSPFQENKNLTDAEHILPTKDLQHNLIATTTTSQPQIPSSLVANSTRPLYDDPAVVDTYNLVLVPTFEDFNTQPSILPQNYFSPNFFHYIHYGIPEF
ncbi:hypothetical protein C1645_845728 [Glomus cerebriforme]|uniref:HMG box domain-containing protein n=1 Tax=Glomus cerebriforme TaxID=658196 RepID=A0A397T530_9GLOM|nr:hypothetical protein C1645_845728 [Glomus cerebriforme]